MVVEDMPEFQPDQRVRVRDKGVDPRTHPDTGFLGNEGTIQYGAGNPEGGPPIFYFVEFDSEEVRAIGADWLELT